MNPADVFTNAFKDALVAGRPQIGLWMALADPYATEVVGGAGFDWLMLDGEHAPNDLRSILAQMQVLAAYPVMPMVRPPVGDPIIIKQLLDIGVQTFLMPMVETAGQAVDLVRSVRYPPRGMRGVGSALARASRWNRAKGYLQDAERGLCLLVQVESARGLDELDAIAAVEGVDGVFIGPADLSASLGHLGDPGHAEVQAAIDNAIVRVRLAGKAAGILAFDELAAIRYLEMGCLFVAVGAEITLLARQAESLAKRVADAISKASLGAPASGTSELSNLKGSS